MIRICPACSTSNRIPAARLQEAAHCGQCHRLLLPVDSPVAIDDEADFADLVAHSPLPVLADFWAPWCGPCRRVAPELEKLASERAGELVVAKVNTDDLSGLARRFAISAIPTLVLFRAGAEVDREAGAMPRPEIVRRFGL
jgi:thioredoxin 2